MKQTYPVLRETVRIKKERNFCWISELLNDSSKQATSKEAFILTLCNGENEYQMLVHIYANVFHFTQQKAEEKVSETLDHFSVCLTFYNAPQKIKVRYQPTDFLFDLSEYTIETAERFSSPAEMTLVLNHTCNFRCIYCYNDSSSEEAIEMNTSEWIDIIHQAKELGVIKCTITGGEPFVHPGIFAILQELKANDILTYICTNGSLIDEEAVLKLKKLEIPVIQISLDSALEEKHHFLTQTSNTYHKVLHAIELLVEAGIKVYIKAVVLPQTVYDIEQLIDLCKAKGVSNLVLDQYDLSYVGRGSNQFFLSKEQENYVQKVVKAKKEEIKKQMNINLMLGERCWKSKEDIVMCGAFYHSFIVMPNGDYSICEKLGQREGTSVGNYSNCTLKEMWASKKIEEILSPKQELLEEPCKECEYFERCKTGCFAAKQFVSDDLYAADPRCWRAKYDVNQFVLQ